MSKDALESSVQPEIMLAASRAGMTLWRNNVGAAWQGKRQDLSGATVTLPNGKTFRVDKGILLSYPRLISFGLCEGSSDLIGIEPIEIQQKHVGTMIARFAGVEVKARRGRLKEKQGNFRDFVNNAGGLGIVARSAAELLEKLRASRGQ